MASRTFTSNRGKDRITISTILTHLPFFHEAGFEFKTERKKRVGSVWWNPFTWAGFEWVESAAVNQPSINNFVFIQGADHRKDPSDFLVVNTPDNMVNFVGHFKSSCVLVGSTGATGSRNADSVTNVEIDFTYNGIQRTLKHSDG
jgi:hypothetical protein